MPASLTVPPLSCVTDLGDGYFNAASPTSEQRQPSAALAVNSQDLLQGQKTVAIAHNGATYRLQATRLGKLILTK